MNNDDPFPCAEGWERASAPSLCPHPLFMLHLQQASKNQTSFICITSNWNFSALHLRPIHDNSHIVEV
ncbi:MAG: hypothetical protein LWX23_03235, partial [Spirochaetia bacterium]|nr:hypothetical protein [Spirochaetia bacterium]